MSNIIAYYMVFTERQRRVGLVIEARRTAVYRFADAEGLHITCEYVEAESGKGVDALERRPQLAAALAAARTGRCPVVVAKLDRLSRDVAFVAGLMAQRVPFLVAVGLTNSSRQFRTKLDTSKNCVPGRVGAGWMQDRRAVQRSSARE